MRTNLLFSFLFLSAVVIWGLYLMMHFVVITKVVSIPYPVGEGQIKDCLDKGGDFYATNGFIIGTKVKATCTLPSSTIVY